MKAPPRRSRLVQAPGWHTDARHPRPPAAPGATGDHHHHQLCAFSPLHLVASTPAGTAGILGTSSAAWAPLYVEGASTPTTTSLDRAIALDSVEEPSVRERGGENECCCWGEARPENMLWWKERVAESLPMRTLA